MIDRPEIGASAPTINLPSSTGSNWRLDDHRGRPVVVIFHRHNH